MIFIISWLIIHGNKINKRIKSQINNYRTKIKIPNSKAPM